MTDPGTSKLANNDTVRIKATSRVKTTGYCSHVELSVFFQNYKQQYIGLDSNVTDTALNSLFISRACALCGLTARFLSASIHL